jgi:hypothetical protein
MLAANSFYRSFRVNLCRRPIRAAEEMGVARLGQ